MRLTLVSFILLTILFSEVRAIGPAEPGSQPVITPLAAFYFDDQSFIPEAESSLVQARRRLIDILGDSLDYKPAIYLTSDLHRFNQLIGERFPDWGAAAAIPLRKEIVIKSPKRFPVGRPLGELVAHEYAHLALAHRTGFREPPRWFDEGLAMYVSMEWGWSNNLAMSRAAVFRQFIGLSDIDRVNRFSSDKAQVAYAQSYLAVKYLISQYGHAGVTDFLNEIAKGHSPDAALMAATGSNYADFEKEYFDYLAKRYNITSLLMDTSYFWIALAFLLALGGFLKFRRRRRYYEKWREEERFESRDFDYGDSDHPEQLDDDEDDAWRR
ncbi:hypothetical protein C3F09_10190 [candidate division GN15 bacterium]|uniref:Peptidase MA-like domain-containing protein n=1 Tax=candidate division GN15 bacterium TaxID=2072418 RepID=A0A855X4A1_9BACT|nr:MAG: hypothetical protein C3F09_10190 [candidate division GN15 bacterium]